MINERAVIAAMFQGGHPIIRVISPLLEPYDFADDVYGFLYERMRSRWLENSPVDAVVLSDDLKQAGVGGDDMLSSLSREAVTLENAYEYANLVYRDSMLRQLSEAGSQTGQFTKESGDFRGVLAMAQSMLDSIAERDSSREDGDIKRILAEGRVEKEKRSRSSRPLGYMTGISQYDKLADGLRKRHVHLLSAYNSVGKSWVMISSVLGFLRDGAHVNIFSLEMSKQQLLDRLLANITGIDTRRISRLFFYSDEEVKAYEEAEKWLENQPLVIYTRARSMGKIGRLVRFNRPDIAVVDYLQKLEGEPRESRYEALTRGFNSLTSICERNDCGGLCLSQISEDQRFNSKLYRGEAKAKGSGDVGAGADFAADCERDKVEAPGILKINYSKNRHGPTGYAEYSIDLTTGRLEELSATI